MKNINWSAISIKSLAPKSFSMPFLVNLQRREKMAIAIAGAALVVFLIFQLIIFPILDRQVGLRKEIVSKREDLKEIQIRKAEYQSLSRHTSNMENRLKKRSPSFSLFSFIDGLAGKGQIKSNIIYMKPATANIKNSSLKLSTVEMKLNSVTMEQITAFLHGVEDKANAVWIKRITLSKGDKNEDLLNAVLQVETFQR